MRKERRRRLSRPRVLVVTGLFFLLLPVINIVTFAWFRYEMDVGKALTAFRWFELGILAAALPAGIGLLMVTRWGWYYFLGYAMSFLLYNITVFVLNNQIYNFSAVLQSFIGAVAIVYFTSQDTFAPYMKAGERGWRMQLRRPVKIKVKIDEITRESKDVSKSGMYVKWINCDFSAGQEVNVSFSLLNERFELKGGIVRIDKKGVGIAFRYVGRNIKNKLKKKLMEFEIQKNTV